MAKVFKIINDRLKKKMIKNSEEVVKEWGGTILEKDELIFSMDVEKMFTIIEREGVVNVIQKLTDSEDTIKQWKKE